MKATQVKTVKQAAQDSGISETLIRSVIRQLGGRESLEDVANHGASAGWCGFTYYSDTVKFFKAHKRDIRDLVKQIASSLGETPMNMVRGFRCLSGPDDWNAEIARCLYEDRLKDADKIVANALAWFALEEVARAFES